MAYRVWSDIANANSQGSSVLSGLSVSIPGLRIQKINLLENPKTKRRANAIIQFDRGEGTKQQMLLFLGEEISMNAQLKSQWWAPFVQERHLGVAIKGSMTAKTENHQFLKDLFSVVKEHPGSVVVGSPVEITTNMRLYDEKKIHVPNTAMGYGSLKDGVDAYVIGN